MALAFAWAAVPAAAAPPDNPPRDAGRDVIGEAETICSADPEGTLAAACAIVDTTKSLVIGGRNSERNMDALLKQASSAVLSLFNEKVEDGASYLCSYADKIAELQDRKKLADDLGLAQDARNLAETLGFPGCVFD